MDAPGTKTQPGVALERVARPPRPLAGVCVGVGVVGWPENGLLRPVVAAVDTRLLSWGATVLLLLFVLFHSVVLLPFP
jgi:hypothetical protein